MPTISIVKGRGYLAHNRRTIKRERERSWDEAKAHLNEKWIDDDLSQVYDELFGEAVKEYNAKQTRDNRKIKSYLEKIERSKQEKPFYELVIAIGDMESVPKGSEIENKAVSALKSYVDGFSIANPNFRAFGAYLHRDEKGVAHVHLDYVPFATGSKRGLRVKNSHRGALKAMGYTGGRDFADWRDAELARLRGILAKNGLEYVQGQGRSVHYSVDDYRAFQSHAEREADELIAKTTEKAGVLSKKTVLRNPDGLKSTLTATMAENAMLRHEVATAAASRQDLRQRQRKVEGFEKVIQGKEAELEAFKRQYNALVDHYNSILDENRGLQGTLRATADGIATFAHELREAKRQMSHNYAELRHVWSFFTDYLTESLKSHVVDSYNDMYEDQVNDWDEFDQDKREQYHSRHYDL